MLSFNSVNDHHHLPSSPVLSLSSRCTTPRSAPFRHQDLDLHMEPSTGCGFQSTSFQRKPLQNSAPEENILQESTTISLPATSKLNKLIQQLKSLLGSDGLTSEDIDISKVKALMESYESDESEWAHLALHDPSRNYSRNGIININNNANLLILVWSPGKSSAIHDHANAHCCMKVLKGQLVESLYDIPEAGGRMGSKSHSTLESGQVGYISDDIGLHKISNPMAECSVSLHLYTPPYAMLYGCSMYESGTGAKHHVDMSKYYSWQGQLTKE